MRQKTPTKPSIEVRHELGLLSKRMAVANRSSSSIRSYCRAIEKLSIFHQDTLRSLEIDQLIDFLYHLQHDKGLNWRTIKLYVAGLRYYYQEVIGNVKLAQQILDIPRSKKEDLLKIRKALNVLKAPIKVELSTRELVIKTYGKDPNLCPKCYQDTMVVVEIHGGIRGSPRRFFAKDKKVQLEMN